MKETILITVVIVSVILIFFTFKKLRRSTLSPNIKALYYYLTVLCPVVGFLLAMRIKLQK